MGIIRELNKESSIYSYIIYTIDTWSMLVINNLTLKYIYRLWIHHTITTRQICYNHACYNSNLLELE